MRRGWGAAAFSLALCACLSSANLSGGEDKQAPLPSPTSSVATCGAADLQTDVGNCGACGKVCGNYANAYGLCKAAKCAIGCNTGFGDCDGKIETGCESTLATDSMHCGACGHSCGGARCVAGQCQPFTLAELPGSVTSIAGDATHLYYGYDGGGANYAIGRIAKDGSAGHADVVTGIAKYPYALGLTATDVYWVKPNEAAAAAPGDGQVHRAPKTGGVAGAPWLSNLKTSTQLVVADANAFFPTYDSQARTSTIGRAALGGTAAVDNTTGIKGSVASLTAEGAFLYYYAYGDGNPIAGRGLFKCPTSGCATASTAIPGLPANGSALQLTTNGGLLYFVQSSRTISRMKTTGEELTPLVTMDDTYGTIRSFAVDGQRLYWIEYHYDLGGGITETYSAWSCPLSNCSDGRQEIELRGQYVYGLHVDDKAAYIVVRTNTGTANVTQVLKVVK